MSVEKMYTVADVASITGMTSRTIRNYLKDGSLTGVKIGVQWRFTEDEISKLFSRRRPGTKSPSQAVKAFLGEPDANAKSIILIDKPVNSAKAADKEYEKTQAAGEDIPGVTCITYEFHESPGLLRIAVEGTTKGISELLKKLGEC